MLDTDRRASLLGTKLGVLIAGQLGERPPTTSRFPPGAAARVGDDAWVLLDEQPERGLGPALAWAVRQRAQSLHVLADRATAVLARRAERFAFPIHVWRVSERALLPAVAQQPVIPEPARADHLALADTIVAGGADLAVEWGVVTGEVRGLEVCRVVDDPVTGETTLEVGVGAHDREAFAMLHGAVPTVESLARVVRDVARHRVVGAPPHPLNQLARGRFVRWRIIAEPSLIGAGTVDPVEPPSAQISLSDVVPCAGVADRGARAEADVVCSAGVDLDLVPYAADVQRDDHPLRIVIPQRHLLPVTRELAALLRTPPTFVTLDG